MGDLPAHPARRHRHLTRSAGAWRAGHRHPWRALPWYGLCAATFLLLGVVAEWHVWTAAHPSTTGVCGCGDPAQTIWFLAWVAHALGHGVSPFQSTLQFSGQGGVNLLDNTVDLVQATLLAPVTALAGPVAALNVGVTLSPLVSGLCALWAARKVLGWAPAAAAVATVWACTPVVVEHAGFGHLQLSWAVGAPLALGALWDAVVTQHHPWVRDAALLCAVTVVTFFVSTEQLVLVGTAAGLCVAIAAVVALARRDHLRQRVGHAVRAIAGAAGASAVLLAWPAWEALAGPRHITGPPWPNLPSLGAPATAVVSEASHVMPRSLADLAGYLGRLGPAVDYLGPVLAGLVLVSLVVLWRRRATWILAGTGLCTWVLSWGVSPTHWTPWRALDHLPLLVEITPDRFGEITVLVAAVLIGAAATALAGRPVFGGPGVAEDGPAAAAGRPLGPDRRRPTPVALAWAFVAVAVLGAGFVVSAEHLPYRVRSIAVPAWFTAPDLPPGARVVALPYPSSGIALTTAWQAISGLRVAVVGGDAFAPAPGEDSGPAVRPILPDSLEGILDALSFPLDRRPPADATTLRVLRAGIGALHVAAVVVAPVPPHTPVTVATDFGYGQARAAEQLLARALGRPPVWRDGAWVFTAPPRR